MKLVYPVCCGVDVHKKSIVATIVITDANNVSTYLQKTFSTLNTDLYCFHNWLKENNCYHVCMESTGKYWIPIFNVLESDIHVILTHPKYVKAIKGKKLIKKILNGLLIYLNLIWLKALLFHPRKSVNFVK